MFKNTLFLKIILIFTLPALGILYFSSVLVYEKIQSFNEVDGINHNLTYLINTEKLLSSLQKEREISALLLLEKGEKSSLEKSRELSIKNYEELEKTFKTLNLDNKVIQLKSEINKLELFRAKIDNLDATVDEVFEEYNQFDKVLLDSLYSLKPVKSAFDFNDEFRNVIHFLSFKESICIEKTMVNAYFINTKINDKLYTMLMKNYSLLEINKDIFLNNVNLEIVQIYNSKLNEEYYNKIFILRNGIKNKNFSHLELTSEEWDKISLENLESLNNMYKNLIYSVEKYITKFEEDALLEKRKSLIFLFVSFSTLISLLFVLKNIIFNEQKSFYKVQKHKEVYELLNKISTS